MDNGNTKLVLGTPTDLELHRLKTAFPNPKVGDKYTDETLSEIMGHAAKTSRYRTVIDRWRRYLMRNSNLLLLRERMEGYFIANAEQRLDYSVDKKVRGDRQHHGGFVVLGSTDKKDLSQAKQVLYDHHMHCLSRNELARLEDKRRMKVLPPAPVRND